MQLKENRKTSFILSLLILFLIFTNQQSINDKQKPSQKVIQTYNSSSPIFQIFGNNKCQIPSTPQKFAIATVTRFRATGQNDLKQGIDYFKQFLNQYAEMQCDVFDSVYFIWNNEKAPEEYPGLLERKQHWKKNVYFIQTKFNSMDHRFAFPSWVQQQVFMSLDDDADIDCENIKKAFSQWQDHVVGGLGPFGTVQMSSRTMEYRIAQDQFIYQYGTKSYISMALPNIGIMPRHFYDLYYANLPEFQQMRNLVSEFSNCDDIGLNFMIGYIYPELRPVAFQGINARLKSFKIEINKTPTHGQKRNDCLNMFSQILGENTWSYSVINRKQEYQKIKQDPLRTHECILALKRAIVEKKYLNHDHYYNFMKAIYVYNSTQLPTSLSSQINMDKYILSLPQQAREELIISKKINLSYKQKHTLESIFPDQNQIAGRQRQTGTQSEQYSSVQRQNKVLVDNLTTLEQQFETLKIVLIITNIFLVIIVLGVLLRFCMNFSFLRKQRKKGQEIQESFTTEMQSEISNRITDDK